MKAYSIFDDFADEAIKIIINAGIDLTVHPLGISRPDENQMKVILENYDCVIIGTSQKIKPNMFENINTMKFIVTASVGIDHIMIPKNKKHLIKIFNSPKANIQSVAEYTIGVALNCCKRLVEGIELYKQGKNNKQLLSRPEDLFGKIIGVIGAGNISMKIMEYASFLGMKVIYWTAHPEKHIMNNTYKYMQLEKLIQIADIISVNLPNNVGTRNIISKERVALMKKECIFISVSRLDTIDLQALVDRAEEEDSFYVNLDLDVDEEVLKMIENKKHVYITPHIGGGTIEARKRMFIESSTLMVDYVKKLNN